METVEERETLSLHGWHLRYFKRLGFERHVAETLHIAGVDPHEAEDLLERGCSHELAVELLT